jgi:DNA-binding transcriptional MerR regulator
VFTVGEFATLAHVSRRLLRYYDEIGLFRPAHADAATGYRYYSAEQLAVLNRILVLKELGLSLEQIHSLLHDGVSTDEMQGMLLLKKAEIEQQLRDELKRVRMIEARLQAVRDAETDKPLDVIIKPVAAQAVLSLQMVFETFDDALRMQRAIRHALPEKQGYGFGFLMCHDDDILDRDMNLEIGCLLPEQQHVPVALHDGRQLSVRSLPAVETMATTVVQGPLEVIHAGYGDLGRWASLNGYRPTGQPREITLKMASSFDAHDLITEIQYPVLPLH